MAQDLASADAGVPGRGVLRPAVVGRELDLQVQADASQGVVRAMSAELQEELVALPGELVATIDDGGVAVAAATAVDRVEPDDDRDALERREDLIRVRRRESAGAMIRPDLGELGREIGGLVTRIAGDFGSLLPVGERAIDLSHENPPTEGNG